MKLRLSFLASVAVAMVLALVGVFNNVSTTRALMPLPIQPFASDALGGISTNQLGQSITANWTVTQTLQGERSSLPWIFSDGRADGSGFTVDLDATIPDGTSVGTVWTNIDVNCDGGVDFMADNCNLLSGGPLGYEGRASPLVWLEATANKGALGSDDFLLTIMPPWPWLVRHKVDIDHLCIGTGGASAATTSVLNTVYAQVPFSPGGNSFVAQTQLGGSPTTPPSVLCLDSPQSSESVTEVYNNPSLAGTDTSPADGLDDNSGLYARWTILQSKGSTSLNKFGDLRKEYQSPPSILSDSGYVERIIDLQCFWIDGDDDCPDGGDGVISEVESWNDPDMPAAYSVIDTDGDCIIEDTYAQDGQPSESEADDALSGSLCPVLEYSENPVVVQYDENADSDCDGLVDGIELAYGSSPALADTDGDGATDFVEMFQFTDPTNTDTDGDGFLDKPENNYVSASPIGDQCTNNWDDDGDRKINDGCPAVGDAELSTQCNDTVDDDSDTVVNDGCAAVGGMPEIGEDCEDAVDDDSDTYVNDGCPRVGPAETNCTDDVDNDSDGYVNDGCKARGDAVAEDDGSQGEYGETPYLDDNCPSVANPDQTNSDGLGRDNGVNIGGNYASNPNADKWGDACDPDDDNDLAVDGYEDSEGTDDLVLDTDCDTVMDGAELHLGSDPLDDPSCKAAQTCSKPSWTSVEVTYFRGCHIAVPLEGSYPSWNTEYDGNENDVENDADGDGQSCTDSPSDKDSDNGTGTGSAGPSEVVDKTEGFGYNTGLTAKDTDGDGCEDWVEMHDLDGNRTVDSGDALLIAKRFAGIIGADPCGSDMAFDVDRNGKIDSGDSLSVAKNSCTYKVGMGGCAPCPSDQ